MTELDQEIIPFLYEPVPDDPAVIEARGSQLQSYMARLSKMLTDAKYYQDHAIVSHARESKKEVPSTVMNSFVKAKCANENYLATLIESLLKKCYAENDWLRTLLSKAKEEIKVNQQNRN